jgi:hypothetical protein
MTRKDYILLADALNLAYKLAADRPMPHAGVLMDCVESVAEFIATALASDNVRFNREHFLAVVRGERTLQSRPPRKAA